MRAASDSARTRGRPQSEASTTELMRATLEVVAARGYHAATLHEIVARAGSSKPTVYRRWRSKPRLVADAIRYALAAANPVLPDTGAPLRDLRLVIRNVIRALATTPLARVLAAVLGVAETEPELAAALLDVERERRRLLRAAVVRVVAALAPDFDAARDPDLDVDLILGALYFRVLMRRMRPRASFADDLTSRLYRAKRRPATPSATPRSGRGGTPSGQGTSRRRRRPPPRPETRARSMPARGRSATARNAR